MTKQTNIWVPNDFNNSGITITNSDSTNIKDLFTAGANGSDVRGITVTSNDTSARILQLYRSINGTDYLIGSVNIPAASGTDGSTASINFISSLAQLFKLDNAGNKVISLMSGGKLKVASTTQVTSGKAITIFAEGVDY